MEVDFAFLANYAENQPSGLAHAIGIGFDTIYAVALPHTHPLFYAVLRLRFSSVEVGDKPIGIRVVDADGNNIVPPTDTSVKVEAPPAGYFERSLTMTLGLNGVKFEKYGSYAVCWLLQGTEVKRTSFRIAPPPSTA